MYLYIHEKVENGVKYRIKKLSGFFISKLNGILSITYNCIMNILNYIAVFIYDNMPN